MIAAFAAPIRPSLECFVIFLKHNTKWRAICALRNLQIKIIRMPDYDYVQRKRIQKFEKKYAKTPALLSEGGKRERERERKSEHQWLDNRYLFCPPLHSAPSSFHREHEPPYAHSLCNEWLSYRPTHTHTHAPTHAHTLTHTR